MAATATGYRPPLDHPRPSCGNLHSYPNSSVGHSGQQDSRPQSAGQDPGPSSLYQHHVSARPGYYVSPLQPPFLQYQWPMPISYNPFAGFQGMGYGIVMPSFAPNPFMESPTYIVPHPPIQAIDNRRLLHPQVHTPCAPYQNPNPTRRVRLPHSVPVRELTDSAVQTEPTLGQVGGYADGSPPVRLDSGHGTASNSPSSSSTTSKNQGSSGVDNHEKSCVTTTLETQKCPKDSAGKENVPPYRNARCDMWSVGSPDSIVPVCSSSQQEDEVVKGRCMSFPNLLSWERGTPKMQKMSDEVLHLKENHRLSGENEVGYEKSVYRSPTGPQGRLVANIEEPNDDARNLSSSLMFPDHEQEKGESNPPEDLSEVSRYQMVLHNYQVRRKLNESIWSVESLVPFIPNKEVLVQKNNVESEKITGIREKDGNSQLLNDNASDAKGSQQGHITAHVGKKNAFVSLTLPLCQTTLSTTAGEEADGHGFSELVVDQNPYQEPATESKWQRKRTSSKEKESLFLSFAAGEKISMGQMIQNGGNVEGGTTMSKASQSNAHLVNRSIQCSTILPCSHNCWGDQTEDILSTIQIMKMKRANGGKDEGFPMTG